LLVEFCKSLRLISVVVVVVVSFPSLLFPFPLGWFDTWVESSTGGRFPDGRNKRNSSDEGKGGFGWRLVPLSNGLSFPRMVEVILY
jgi:hypothetical protein